MHQNNPAVQLKATCITARTFELQYVVLKNLYVFDSFQKIYEQWPIFIGVDN